VLEVGLRNSNFWCGLGPLEDTDGLRCGVRLLSFAGLLHRCGKEDGVLANQLGSLRWGHGSLRGSGHGSDSIHCSLRMREEEEECEERMTDEVTENASALYSFRRKEIGLECL